MDYDHFSIYGFEVEYPKDWVVELNPKSMKKKGDVAFYVPEKDRIFVSWGMLEEAKKRYESLDKHVDDAIHGNLRRKRAVKSMEVAERKKIETNGHTTIFNHLKARVAQSQSLFNASETSQEIWSTHHYCEQTARYFVLYGYSSSDDDSKEYVDVFEHMQRSFRCHEKVDISL